MISDPEVNTEGFDKDILQAGILMIRKNGTCKPFAEVHEHAHPKNGETHNSPECKSVHTQDTETLEFTQGTRSLFSLGLGYGLQCSKPRAAQHPTVAMLGCSESLRMFLLSTNPAAAAFTIGLCH